MWRPADLYFGPAGIPARVKKRTTKRGVMEVRALGLDAMEIEFVRRINLTPEAARDVGPLARELSVVLTVHAPYYINLASREEEKVNGSINRIYRSALIGSLAGAWSVCFHPGYYMGVGAERVYEKVKRGIERVLRMLEEEGISIWIRPETTGKPTQFGSLEELLNLSQELEGVMPVVDFAHLHARSGGVNSYEEFREVLAKVEGSLGREGLDNMHIHVSGIEYGERGEKRHVNLEESDLRYDELLRALKEFGVKGVVICESPNLEEDALLLKNTYGRIK